MSAVDAARKEMLAWLADATALRPFVDPNDPARGGVNCAWDEAWVMVNEAAGKYATAVSDERAGKK